MKENPACEILTNLQSEIASLGRRVRALNTARDAFSITLHQRPSKSAQPITLTLNLTITQPYQSRAVDSATRTWKYPEGQSVPDPLPGQLRATRSSTGSAAGRAMAMAAERARRRILVSR